MKGDEYLFPHNAFWLLLLLLLLLLFIPGENPMGLCGKLFIYLYRGTL